MLYRLRGAEAPLFHGTKGPLFYGAEASVFHGTEGPLFYGADASVSTVVKRRCSTVLTLDYRTAMR